MEGKLTQSETQDKEGRMIGLIEKLTTLNLIESLREQSPVGGSFPPFTRPQQFI